MDRFLLGFMAGAVFLLSALLLFHGYLYAVGEVNINNVVERQLNGKEATLFASGINQDAYDYKMTLYQARPHDIVALGSSRVMQLRGEYFSAGFVNFGGAVSSLAALEYISQRIINSASRPKVAIVSIDAWWFNENRQNPIAQYVPGPFPQYASFWQLAVVLRQINSLERLKSTFGSPDRIGLYAILVNAGYDKFGSYHYVSTVVGKKQFDDEKFFRTLHEIDRGAENLSYGNTASSYGIDRLERIIESLNRSGIRTVLIMPPFSHRVWSVMMKSGRYGYISDLTARLNGGGVALYDYSDPSLIPASQDCEFLDGIHGGDVIYARMLQDIANRESWFEAYVDLQMVKKIIADYSGHAAAVTNFQLKHPAREVDFLRLGCTKRPATHGRPSLKVGNGI